MASHVTVTDETFGRLRLYNLIMGALHGLQALAVVVLATDFTLPVTAAFPEGPPGTPAGDPIVLFDLSIPWGVVLFLALSALFHLLLGTVLARRYRAQLSTGQNQFRWLEYGLSSSVMILLIAVLPGISNIAALIGLFAVNAGMIMFGSVQERYEEPGGSLWPFWIGSLLGIVPWIAIGIYLVSPAAMPSLPASCTGSSSRCLCSSTPSP